MLFKKGIKFHKHFDQYVDILNPDLGLDTGFVIECWFRMDNLEDTLNILWGTFYLAVVQGFVVLTGTGTDFCSPEDIEAGKWTHLSISANHRIIELYLDGQLVARQDNTPFFVTPLPLLRIGKNSTGSLADLRIYNKVRELVAYYRMEETSGQVLRDYVYSNHGIMVNGVNRVEGL